MAVAYTKTAKSISVVVNYIPRVIPSTHPNFKAIVDLVKDPKTVDGDLVPLLDVVKPANKFSDSGNITIRDGQLFFKGYPVNNSLSKIILDLIEEGSVEAARPFELFLENAYQNPDPRAITDLFDWVVHTGLPISPDGHILGWKAVRDDYLSIHSGTSRPEFDHHVGNTLREDRSVCDASPDRTCSRGLHFAAASYLPSYASGGSRIVALKINPRDVVAFPRDYGWAKGRASEYVVVGEVPMADVPTYYPQGKRIHKGWGGTAAADLVKPKAPRNAYGFGVGQVWADRRGVKHTVVDYNQAGDYPILTDLGRFTAQGRSVSDDTVSSFDLVTLVQDA